MLLKIIQIEPDKDGNKWAVIDSETSEILIKCTNKWSANLMLHEFLCKNSEIIIKEKEID